MTTKWIISWNSGCGTNYEVIEAKSEHIADALAYDAAQQDFESNVEYECIGEATDELLREYRLQ